MNIKEIRQKYPQYNDMSDTEFADAFHSKYYSDIPKEDFYKTLGISKPDIVDKALGAGETALSFLTGGLGQIAGGIAGLASAPFVGGVKGANNVEDVTNALTYAPRTESGKKYSEGLGDVFANIEKKLAPMTSKLIAAVPFVGEDLYKNLEKDPELKDIIESAGAKTAMNVLPVDAVLRVPKLKGKAKVDTPIKDIRAVEASMEPPKVEAPKVPEQLELPLETSAQSIHEMQTKGSPQLDLFDPANQPSRLNLQAEPERQAKAAYDASVEQIAKMNEDPNAQGHLDFNDFGNNDPMERMPNMRIDENGMPIRADISMEAQNLENPLQMNMWGDELGPALDQTRSLTEAIDSMPPGEQRQAGIDMLSQDVNADFSLPENPTSGTGSPQFNRFGQGGGQTILNDLAGLAVDGFRKIRSLTSKSPEVIAAREQLAADAKKQRVQTILNGRDSGYLENVTTPEAVIAAADGANDISAMAAAGGKSVSPGINHLAIKTNNPLVKYMRAKTREIFVEADRLTEKYITGPDGIGKLVQKMTPAEKAEVVQLLQLGDKKQQRITRELMDKHGFSDIQKDFVERFYEMDQAKLDLWNQKRAEAGMKPVEGREGHVPGIFKGDFKQLVLSPDGKPLGVIAVDSKWQLNAARKSMLEKFPDAKFSPVRRSSLGGSAGRATEFGAMQELLKMLAEQDPSFKEVQDLISSAIVNEADKAYGAAQHALRKKGIVGNEGNKPWLDAGRNAEDFIKAYLQHWEDQTISHLSLPVEENVRSLMQNPALDNMPRAKSYVDSYLKNMSGRGTGELGQAINVILDTPSRWLGFGPSASREMVQQFNKRMGQYSMGFGNLLFSVTQWLQVAQTGMPELTAAAKQLGVPQAKVIPSLTRAMVDMLSQTVKEPSAELKVTLDEARARGLLTFSEFTDVNKITQSKASAAFDKVADFNRAELGEKPTRPIMFRAAVLMLKDTGLEGKALYDAAYNITQAGMFDYRMNERPMMYQKMGVAGQLAGGLQTFKHAYLGQLNRLGSNGLKDPVSALLAASALVGYAGIMGVPFYQEADQLFQYMTEKAGKRTTIAEYALKEMPRWMQRGAISDITNINMQSRLSSADVLPNSPAEAISPWFSTVGRIGQAVGDVASFNDKLAWGNLGTQLAPQGPLKGLAEKAFSTDDEGYVLNREGLRGNVRTEWDKGVRTFTGGRSLDEAITGENQYNSGQRLKGYRDTQKSIMEKVKRDFVQGNLTQEQVRDYAKKFTDAKGDPDQFVRDLIEFAKTAKLDKQRRLQGIPSGSLSSLYKYQEYSDDVSK